MKIIIKKLTAVFFISVLLPALTGCKVATTSEVEGTQWKLVGWTISSIFPADVTITVEFEDGQITGNSGVNTYGGPCRLGPADAFTAGPIMATEMAGSETAMRAEAAYLTLLGQAGFYSVADGRLTLYDEDENELLIFEATQP
jgi:heat shock protein HslJ